MTNLDSILKSRDITLPTCPSRQSYSFSSSHVWMWESWTITKTECQRINVFELWWCRRLQSPLEDFSSPRKTWEIQPVHPEGNQSLIFIGRTVAEAETPIVANLMWRTDSLEKTLIWERLKAEGEGDNRGWDGWMASPTQWTWVWVNSRSWWWTGKPGVLQYMGLPRVRQDWATELTEYDHCNLE